MRVLGCDDSTGWAALAAACLVGALAWGCQKSPAKRDGGTPEDAPRANPCEALYGLPNQQTGLDETQCRPACGCGGDTWEAPTWDAARIAALRGWTLLDAPGALGTDPYAGGAPPPAPQGQVCALVVADLAARTYRLTTFASAAEASAAGAYVTHEGACGLCSTLQDLAVYAENPDLTAPVRTCGLQTWTQGHDALLACIEALGFTSPCAQIWAYDTEHTRTVCGSICVPLLNAPYNDPDGGLNACLACDEVQSGPVFKSVAGRTRRNSGLASAICRPCSEVPRIAHDYP